jgi:hypothetical protein
MAASVGCAEFWVPASGARVLRAGSASVVRAGDARQEGGTALIRQVAVCYSLALPQGARLRTEHCTDVACDNGHGDESEHAQLAPRSLPTVLRAVKMLTKWLSSARLETRTKESNMCASIRVINPQCAMKVKAA